MTTTVHSAMKDNQHKALRGVALVLGVLVYLAGLIYAGVRSYDLFARTVPPDLLPLAVLGILALELSALGLPLAVHYWTAPGVQRMAALGFYLLDLLLIVANSILDAAQRSGTVLPDFMWAYGTFAVPALPVLCMAGWALLYALDPASKERDMTMAVQAATREALMGQVIEATKGLDITSAVQDAAEKAARALVGETLGRQPAAPRLAPPSQAPAAPVAQYAAQQEPAPVVAAPRRHSNGTGAAPGK